MNYPLRGWTCLPRSKALVLAARNERASALRWLLIPEFFQICRIQETLIVFPTLYPTLLTEAFGSRKGARRCAVSHIAPFFNGAMASTLGFNDTYLPTIMHVTGLTLSVCDRESRISESVKALQQRQNMVETTLSH